MGEACFCGKSKAESRAERSTSEFCQVGIVSRPVFPMLRRTTSGPLNWNWSLCGWISDVPSIRWMS